MSGNQETRSGTTASTDSAQGSEALSDPFVAVTVGREFGQGHSVRVEAPEGVSDFHVRRSRRVATSRARSLQPSVLASSALDIVETLPGGKRKVGYAYQVLDPVGEEVGSSFPPAAPTENAGVLRDLATPQLGTPAGPNFFAGRKRAASSVAQGSGRPAPRHLASAADFSPTHFDEPASEGVIPPPALSQHYPPLPSPGQHPPSPMRIDPVVMGHSEAVQQDITPFSSPISQNPLVRKPVGTHTPSPSRRRSVSFRTRDGDAAWAAAEGLLPIAEGFTAPGYVPAQVVGGITYKVHSPRTNQPTVPLLTVGRQLFAEHSGIDTHTPRQQQPLGSLLSRPQANMQQQQLAPLLSRPQATMQQPQLASHYSRPQATMQQQQLASHLSCPQAASYVAPHIPSGRQTDVRATPQRTSQANRLDLGHQMESTGSQFAAHADIYPGMHHHKLEPQSSQALSAPQFNLSPDDIAAIARALGHGDLNPATSRLPTRKFFSNAITNNMSDLPTPVIKELKAGFKNYIPLALCTHKACLHATRHTDSFDTEIGLNDKGEIKVKPKSMTPARDHYITTDDFTEIRENFIRGMRRYLAMTEDGQAEECADMFAEFFSVIAARPDFTQDWSSYRGYIVESYVSWVGRRDDSYGLIFDEQLFYKHKMTNLVPVILEQLRQPSGGNNIAAGGRGSAGPRGRGRGFQGGNFFPPTRGGYQAQGSATPFLPQQPSVTFKCYLCGGLHLHKEHQGAATRLVANEQGKWVDKALGNRIVCISFNVSSAGCKRGASCAYSHSCSLCGDLSHGSARCGA